MTTTEQDDVRRALAVPSHEITAAHLAILRAAAEQWLVQQEALQRAVVELRAFAAERGVPVVSIPARQSGTTIGGSPSWCSDRPHDRAG